MTLSADINADVSGFTSGVSKAETSLSGFQSKCKKAGEEAEGAGKKSESGGNGVKGFGDKCKAAASGASSFSSKVSALTVAAGNLIANLAGKAIDYVASLGSEMVEASDSAQKFASTLEFAGIDTGTIDKLTKSTQAYADATVYDLADIRNVTAQLAANGVSDYAKLAEAAGNLNAVAGGNADTFRSVATVMTQTAGAGKLTTENWNQLSDAIPGASGALQQAMKDAGAFEGNFREAMAKGQISAEEFNAAVMKLGMDQVAVDAATNASTIEASVGNLEAAIVGVGSQAITALNPFITGTLGQLTAGISQLPTLFQSLLPVLAPVGEAFTTAFSTVAPAVQELANAVGPTIVPLLQQVMSVVSALAPVVAAVVTSVLGAATQLAPLIVPLLQQVMTVMTALAPIIQTVATTVIGMAAQIAATVIPIVTQIVTYIQTYLPMIQTIITNAMTVIQAIVTAACNVIQSVWNVVWPAIQTVVETVMGVINGIITTVLGLISGDWSAVWTGIQQVAQSIWDGIGGIVEWAINTVAELISDVLESISSAWESAWDAIGSFLEDCWNGITDALSSAVDGVVEFFTGLPDRILGALGDVGSLLWDAGTSIIDGLLGGLQSAAEGMFGWVGTIADTIASLKGPLPYDRKLLIPNGTAIMDSLYTGLQKGWPQVEDLMKQVTSDIRNYPLDFTANVREARSGSDVRPIVRETGDTYNFYNPVRTPYETARAIRMLESTGILGTSEVPGAKKVLGAAAMTYVAAVVGSLLQLLRLLILSGRIRNDD